MFIVFEFTSENEETKQEHGVFYLVDDTGKGSFIIDCNARELRFVEKALRVDFHKFFKKKFTELSVEREGNGFYFIGKTIYVGEKIHAIN